MMASCVKPLRGVGLEKHPASRLAEPGGTRETPNLASRGSTTVMLEQASKEGGVGEAVTR